MALTPSQKAQRTRLHKKASQVMEETVVPEYEAWETALDMYTPLRDAIIERLEIERLMAIQKIEDEFRTQCEIAQAEFLNKMKPTQLAYDEAQSKAWAVYRATMADA
jgi:hypothetical protein